MLFPGYILWDVYFCLDFTKIDGEVPGSFPDFLPFQDYLRNCGYTWATMEGAPSPLFVVQDYKIFDGLLH